MRGIAIPGEQLCKYKVGHSHCSQPAAHARGMVGRYERRRDVKVRGTFEGHRAGRVATVSSSKYNPTTNINLLNARIYRVRDGKPPYNNYSQVGEFTLLRQLEDSSQAVYNGEDASAHDGQKPIQSTP